jgi:hypothetical protein
VVILRRMGPVVLIERQEKEKALALVESSETFARQDQLKAFLRFVCEYEIFGRGGELHEYLIGTEVLGQPTGYSTAENSIVRNRAHSLRRKLQDFYSAEAPAAAIRIEIPKGSYCPHFVFSTVRESISPPAHNLSVEVELERTSSGMRPLTKRKSTVAILVAILVACLVSSLGGYWLAARRGASAAVDPAIREAWGPLLGQNAHTMICIATVPQLLVRSFPYGFAGFSGEYKLSPSELNLEAWYSQRYQELPGERLYVLPYYNSPLWGDASGAISIARVLSKAGVDVQVLPERIQDAFALRDRNVILLGRPENSPSAGLFLHELYYNVKYFKDIQDEEIYFNDPQTGAPKELVRRNSAIHGLITVIGSSDHRKDSTQVVIISGVNSAGTIGAAEFFSSADRMREFKARLVHDGYKSFPTVYQIVISTEAESYLPFKSWMETYKVITPSS